MEWDKPRPKPIILQLGEAFYDPVTAASFPQATPRFLNVEKAQFLGLNLSAQDWISHFHKFQPFPGNLPVPLALRYHGHQFQHYNPDLGDGRGFLFAQFEGPDGRVYDLGTKGSGQTPYSRAGDGKLTLKGAMREALATEMLESLGARTSKTFCFFETGEDLQRNDEPSPTRSAVLTRLNFSHIRIGTFQRLAYLQQRENLLRLLKYSCENYFADLFPDKSVFEKDLSLVAVTFLTEVSARLASLSAQYMMAGFVHGVLNSDNMNITGESFDYGPYRFLPHYDPNFTAAYFDQRGLYSYGRQPSAIYWNVAQLASCLAWAFPEVDFQPALDPFSEIFSTEMIRLLLVRLNLAPSISEEGREDLNEQLISSFFLFLAQSKAPFEQALFDFHSGAASSRWKNSPGASLYQGTEFEAFHSALSQFSVANLGKLEDPYFQNSKPCTLLIDEIESIWAAIDRSDDWSWFEAKIRQIRQFRSVYLE